jgi:Leucine Rich repeats (2 copies)
MNCSGGFDRWWSPFDGQRFLRINRIDLKDLRKRDKRKISSAFYVFSKKAFASIAARPVTIRITVIHKLSGDLSPLGSLISLQSLNLVGCVQLGDLSPLAGLTSLQSLNLSDCQQVSDISPLAACKWLWYRIWKLLRSRFCSVLQKFCFQVVRSPKLDHSMPSPLRCLHTVEADRTARPNSIPQTRLSGSQQDASSRGQSYYTCQSYPASDTRIVCE